MEPLHEQFEKVLFIIVKGIKRDYEQVLSASGLTFLQFGALKCIEKQSSTLNDIAHHMALKAPTMLPVIDQLEAHGCVTRKPDAHDRRKIQIAISDKGKKLMKELLAVKSASLEKALKILNQEQKKTLLELLDVMAQQFTDTK